MKEFKCECGSNQFNIIYKILKQTACDCYWLITDDYLDGTKAIEKYTCTNCNRDYYVINMFNDLPF